MTERTSQNSTTKARSLRRNQTPAETIPGARLRNRQLADVKFRRQSPIGPYIVDFVSFEHRLVIELDGRQHNKDTMQEEDAVRTELIQSQGYRVLRFWNSDMENNLRE